MFSVVIPLYNKAHTIERTLQSVLNQTYTNFEIIIIDDGSTDNGVEIIQRLTSDSRIKIFNQKNQGVSVARNRGVKTSQYEYIAFLDADDEWMPEFLMKIKEAIEKYPSAGIYGSASYHRNIITGNKNFSIRNKYKNKVCQVDCFLEPNLLPHTSAIVVKKSILVEIDTEYNVFPIGMRVCEDWACFHRIALISSLVFIGIPLGIRNNNVEGQVTKLSDEKRKELYQDVVIYYNLLFNFWVTKKNKNPYLVKFIRYEIRHRIKSFIFNNNISTLELFLLKLEQGLLNSFERDLYNLKKYSYLSILYIYITKIYTKFYISTLKWIK